jgi:pimeloyl-ACP methyl ester carboxylesterase
VPIARSNGYKIHYDVVGDGPPVVLHPGMFHTGADWARHGYTPVLRESHTVITIDPLGMGASDAPHSPAAYTLPRRVEYVTAVLDDVGAERSAFWGYSLGALTALGMAIHAPERCTRLVAGSWDPVDGFQSGLAHAVRQLGLSADIDAFALFQQAAYADPDQAAVIDAGDPAAFRANFDAFSRERDLAAALPADIPQLMYCGTKDPWHGPMRTVAEQIGADFFSVPDANHHDGWTATAHVLPHVQTFLATDA